MAYQKGDKIGGTVFGQVYVGTISEVSDNFYYINIKDSPTGFCLSIEEDNVKPVCKSRSIVYV